MRAVLLLLAVACAPTDPSSSWLPPTAPPETPAAAPTLEAEEAPEAEPAEAPPSTPPAAPAPATPVPATPPPTPPSARPETPVLAMPAAEPSAPPAGAPTTPPAPATVLSLFDDVDPARALLALPSGEEVVVTAGSFVPAARLVVLGIHDDGVQIALVTPQGDEAELRTTTLRAPVRAPTGTPDP